MHSPFVFYLGLTGFIWITLQVMTSPDAQTIFTKTLFRWTGWIYLALAAIISFLVMTLPILITGTIAATAILVIMSLGKVKKNTLINVAILGDVSLNKSLSSNPALLSLRASQCHRARQNYAIITLATNAAYVMGILSLVGILVAVAAGLHTP